MYVVGFSLPPTDAFFRDLLALGLAGSTRLTLFEVVNPDPDVGAKFVALLGPDVRHRYKQVLLTFADWAKRKYGASKRL